MLRQLGDFTTEGMPGVPEDRSIGVGALGTKILCERHNSDLSPLDATAEAFFRSLKGFDADLADWQSAVVSEVATFNGEFLERWLLKVAFGVAAANRRSGRDETLRDADRLLAVLFGRRAFPSGWGFYILGSVGDRVAAPADVAVQTWRDGTLTERRLMAVTVWMRFVPLSLTLGKPDHPNPGAHRPGVIHLRRTDDAGGKELRLTWHDGKTHPVYELTRTTETLQGWAELPAPSEG